MSEPIIAHDAIANHAEAAARHWALNPTEDCPRCPYPENTVARARWNAALQRFLLIYSSVTSDEEGGC